MRCNFYANELKRGPEFAVALGQPILPTVAQGDGFFSLHIAVRSILEKWLRI